MLRRAVRRMVRRAATASYDPSPLRLRDQAAPLVLVVLAFVLFQFDKIWSLSIDLPHHYALAYRIAEQWRLPVQDPSLGGMNDYPWLAHLVVAVASMPLQSVFAGLQLVALLSFAGLWVAIVGLLCTLPRQQAVWSCLALAVLVHENSIAYGYDLHGSEIIRNYFFSQLLAQALALAALWSAVLIERRHGWAVAAAALTLWVQLIAFIHLLPALMLAGAAILLIVLELAPQLWRRSASKDALAWGMTLVALIGITTLLHPAFKSTVGIAANDGDLTLSNITYPAGVRWLCLWAALASVAQLWVASTWRHSQRAVKYVGLYGVTVAGLCVLQMVALKLGHGSHYSVKKYGFALTTHLLLSAALALGWMSERLMRGASIPLPLNRGAAAALVCSALAVVLHSLAPVGQMLRTSEIARLEGQLRTFRDVGLAPPPAGKSDIVLDLHGLPPQISYMMSIAVLHTRWEFALDDIMAGKTLSHAPHYARALTTTAAQGLRETRCQVAAVGPVSVFAPECLTVPVAPCDGRYDFAAPGALADAVINGFSRPESSGRWTDGREATFSCVLDDPSTVRELVLTATPFVYGELQSQRVRITVGANPAVEFNVRSGADLVVPVTALQRGRLDVKLEFPDAASPYSLHKNADGRMLGFRVRALQFR